MWGKKERNRAQVGEKEGCKCTDGQELKSEQILSER